MSQVAVAEDVVPTEVMCSSKNGSTIMPFAAAMEAHQQEIYRYALRLTRNGPDADDLFQETMLKAYRAYHRLSDGANVRAWFYRIATNTFLSEKRRASRERPLETASESQVAVADRDTAVALDARELLREVETFIDALPPKQRVALVLRKHHELGYDEIARVLECSEDAARASVHQGLRKLRDQFGDRL